MKPNGEPEEITVFVTTDRCAPHAEECSFWHGGVCDCHPAMVAARAIEHHCHECDYVNSYTGTAPCNCEGFCICDRDEDDGCSCIGRVPVKPTRLSTTEGGPSDASA